MILGKTQTKTVIRLWNRNPIKKNTKNRPKAAILGFPPFIFFWGGVGGGVVTTVYDLLDFFGRKGGGGVVENVKMLVFGRVLKPLMAT